MRCIVTSFVERERENAMPYFIVKARGTQGSDDVDAVVNGVINFAAVQSRVFNFTKCLFPSTDQQCEQLRKAFVTDDNGNVLNEEPITIYLELFQWETGKRFHIYQNGELLTEQKEVEVVRTVGNKPESHNGRMYKPGETYTTVELQETPRVFTKISLTLLADDKGNIVEAGGSPEDMAKRNFENGLANGIYELCD